MRPPVIIEAIHDRVLLSRERQLPLVSATRRQPGSTGGAQFSVRARQHGFVAGIDLDLLKDAISGMAPNAEIGITLPVGAFVAYGDVIMEIRAGRSDEAEKAREQVRHAIHVERKRDVHSDTSFGIEQLETIAWTSTSSTKQGPAPGLLTVYRLRKILARWVSGEPEQDGDEKLAVVYPDTVMPHLMNALESLVVVSTESMRHQIYTEVLHSSTTLFERLPFELRERAEGLVRRA